MILIVDDDIAVRTSLSLLLKSVGNEIITADNAVQAFEVVKTQKPELVILDLNFSIDTSGKEGMTLLKKIKAFDAAIPVVLITGWASIE
ncbi:MAG: response regulator, partial [Pedobacter sp.]